MPTEIGGNPFCFLPSNKLFLLGRYCFCVAQSSFAKELVLAIVFNNESRFGIGNHFNHGVHARVGLSRSALMEALGLKNFVGSFGWSKVGSLDKKRVGFV